MAQVTLPNLLKRFGTTLAVDDVSLDVPDGELVALLGPSGCGKTTTLRMIAGFIAADAGRILLADRDITGLPPNRRNAAMVFQRYALFPHMTVAQNVAFGLEMRRRARHEIDSLVADALRQVRLQGFEARLPRELSGGQQQRVALARALVIKPDVLLLDEPLSNLDAKLRHEVRLEIRELQKRLGLTTVFVTHDQEEALVLADRLVVMHQGAVQQIGSPTDLYDRPANYFVADFIGKSNFFRGRMIGDREFATEKGTRIRLAAIPQNSTADLLALRPEKIMLGAAADQMPNRYSARIELITYLGPITEYQMRLGNGDTLVLHEQNRHPPKLADAQGAGEVIIGWDTTACLPLADASGFEQRQDHEGEGHG
jgi:putative spermidine/putrescine transport system ATP-binding protein